MWCSRKVISVKLHLVEKLRIDVVSDVVCPWCFVGKRQLELALARLAEEHPQMPVPQVHWHPFQLNPDLPTEGMARSDYLARKFGNPDPGAIYGRVKAAGHEVALELPIEGILRQPNTALAHAFVAAVDDDPVLANRLAEALFHAYFVEHVDFTDALALAGVARSAGLNEVQIEAAQQAVALAQVRARDAQVREQGVSGVPLFVVNQRSVSGAAGVDAIYQLLLQGIRTRGDSQENA
jgi:predicted DsbA family dithiol-disulfide isomerase